MRTFELSTHVQSISRGEGRSTTAAAAYRACCVIDCEREGRRHDYSRKRGLEHAEIVLPKGAPSWAADRAKLWNGAELRDRNGKRGKNAGEFKAAASPAREFMFSFPAELSAAGRVRAAQTIARHLVETHGIAADFSIHEPGKDGDERNHHCHLLTSSRRLDHKGFGLKAREWDDLKERPKLAKQFRAFIAATLNAEIKAEGKGNDVFVEHRSFKERGSSRKAQQHQGPQRTNAMRKELGKARQAWFRQEQTAQRERQGKALAGLKLRQDFNLQRKIGELAQRARDGARAIRAELNAARQADRPPDGMRRVFLTITARAGREAFNRQAREGQRVEAARQKQAELTASLRAERSAYAASQTKERADLAERHRREDGQLRQALSSREQLDRSREVVARTPEQPTLSREREGPGRSIGREWSPS